MSGKSCLLRKICIDWAHSDLKDKCFPFDIVLPINIALVTEGIKLDGILQDQLGLDQLQVKVVEFNLKQHPEKVFFLFDGLDDADDRNMKMLLDFLKRCRKAKYIVASRTENLTQLKSLRMFLEKDIVIESLNLEGIENYIDKYFASQKDFAQGLKDEIMPRDHSKVETLEISFTPGSVDQIEMLHKLNLACHIGYLSIMCLIWAEKQILYQNRNEIFKCLVSVKLRDYEKKNNIEKGTGAANILVRYHEVLMQLGKLASLRKRGKSLHFFSRQELEKTVGESELQYGFLQKLPSVPHFQNDIYCFITPALQQWFKSFYLCNNDKEMKSFTKAILANNHWIYEKSLIRLLIQLDPTKALVPFISILKQEKDNQQYIPRSVQTLVEYYMNDCHSEDFRLLVKAIVKENLETEKIKLCGPGLHNNGEKIAIFLEEIKRCTTLDLKYCFLTANDLCQIILSLQSSELPIKQLILSYNNFKGFGKQIGQLVDKLKCCQEFYFNDCKLTNQDMEEICNSIRKIPADRTITTFGLSRACYGESCKNCQVLVKYLPFLEVFHSPVMQSEDLSEFLQNMISTGRAEKFQTLDLSFSNAGFQNVKFLSYFVNLKELNMKQCGLGNEGLRKLLEIFKKPQKFNHLDRLILCLNEISDAGLAVKLIREVADTVKEIDFGANRQLGNDIQILTHSKYDYFNCDTQKLESIWLHNIDMDEEKFNILKREMKVVGIDIELGYLEMRNLPNDIEDHIALHNVSIEELDTEYGVQDSKNKRRGRFYMVYTDLMLTSGFIHDEGKDTVTKIATFLQ